MNFLPGVPAEYPIEMILADGGAADTKVRTEARFTSSAYFGVMGIPLIAGELCRDDPNDAVVGSMVNQSFARKYFGACRR